MTDRQLRYMRSLARSRRWDELEEYALALPVPWLMLARHARRAQVVLPSLQFVIRVLQLDVSEEEAAHDA